jgi:hypothetical protein
VNGRIVESSSTNYVAIICGLVAIGFAAQSFRLLGVTPTEERMKRIGIMVAIFAVGVFQLLRGFGTFA